MSLAFFKDEDVRVEGNTVAYGVVTDSGNTSTRYFCPNCGSRIMGKNTLRPGITALAVGLLQDRSWFTPAAVVYCSNRDAWDMTSKTVPNHDGMP